MKERPILMHSRSIVGILENRKLQTRRIIKPQPPASHSRHAWFDAPIYGWTDQEVPAVEWFKVKCPYGQPGDRLWVREAFRVRADLDWMKPSCLPNLWPNRATPWYCATGNGHGDEEPSGCAGGLGKKRPGIFMPRSFSRLTLEITGIRVERVQDASIEDIIAEGVRIPVNEKGHPLTQLTGNAPHLAKWPKTEEEFLRYYWSILWCDTNGKGAWDRNDWVFVVDFKKL